MTSVLKQPSSAEQLSEQGELGRRVYDLERQREWGLLRAVGYRVTHLGMMVLAESAALVVGGLLLGASAAALAIAPAIAASVSAWLRARVDSIERRPATLT